MIGLKLPLGRCGFIGERHIIWMAGTEYNGTQGIFLSFIQSYVPTLDLKQQATGGAMR